MKLTLRDLFWITLLIAVGLAWWLDHRHQAARERNARNRIERFLRPNDAEDWFRPERIQWDADRDRRDREPWWSPEKDEAIKSGKNIG